jgi:Phosphotransferase enzyme family
MAIVIEARRERHDLTRQSVWLVNVVRMERSFPGLVADAFGLGRPAGGMVAYSYSSLETWTLDAAAGRVLVKRVSCDGWRNELHRAMGFEQRALGVGIEMPRPISPVAPTFGYAAEVEGLGMVRVYEWVDGRPLADTDDVAEWLGATLARLHRIEPLDQAEPHWYGLHASQQWQDWLAEGQEQQRQWAPALRRRLTDIVAATDWIAQAFRAAGDYVMTHRDVEPWNVLVTDRGPVLVDWDTAGPDSASLEAAQAAVVFAGRGRAEPDVDAVGRTVATYSQCGGRPVGRGRDALARRAGMRLNRLSERLRVTLGHQAPGSMNLAQAEARAGEQLDELPTFFDDLARWSRLLSAGGEFR